MTPAVLLAQAKTQIEQYLPDRATIFDLPIADDGSGGFSNEPVAVESNIPAGLEASNDSEQLVAMAAGAAVTQKLFLKVTANTVAIHPGQQIVIAARDGKAAMTFERPKRLDESYEALVTIGAVLKV